MAIIKLQSSDGEVFPVDVSIARQCQTIRTMLEDLGMDEEEEEVVPLPNVNSAILRKVVQWATYHKVSRMRQNPPNHQFTNDFQLLIGPNLTNQRPPI